MSFTIRSLEDRIVFDAAPAVAAEPADAPAVAAEPADAPDAAERILVVDRAVDNAGVLADATLDGVAVVEYDSRTDTLADLRALIEAARNGGEYASIAFAGHGEAGRYVITADATLETGALAGDMALAEFFAYLGELLAEDGRVDLLGCDIASGTEGMELIDALEELTGIDFAASDDATGGAEHGGDWFLETDDVDLLATYFDAEGIEAFQGLLTEFFHADRIYAVIPDSITAVEGESIFGGFDFAELLIMDFPPGDDAPVDYPPITLRLSFTSPTSDRRVPILEAMGIARIDVLPPTSPGGGDATGIPGQLSYYDTNDGVYFLYSDDVHVGYITGYDFESMMVEFKLDPLQSPELPMPVFDLSPIEAFLGSIRMTLPVGEYLLSVECETPWDTDYATSSVTIVPEMTNNNNNDGDSQNDNDKTGDGDAPPNEEGPGGEPEGEGWIDIDDTDDSDGGDGDSGDTDSTDNADSDSRDFQEALDTLSDFFSGLEAEDIEDLGLEDLIDNLSDLSSGMTDFDGQIDALLASLGSTDSTLSDWLGNLSDAGAELKRNGALAAALLADALRSWRTTPADMRDGMARDLISDLNRYIAAINVRIKSALFSLQTLADLTRKNREAGAPVPAEQLLAQVDDARAKWEAALAESMAMRDRMYFDLKDAAAMRPQ